MVSRLQDEAEAWAEAAARAWAESEPGQPEEGGLQAGPGFEAEDGVGGWAESEPGQPEAGPWEGQGGPGVEAEDGEVEAASPVEPPTESSSGPPPGKRARLGGGPLTNPPR